MLKTLEPSHFSHIRFPYTNLLKNSNKKQKSAVFSAVDLFPFHDNTAHMEAPDWLLRGRASKQQSCCVDKALRCCAVHVGSGTLTFENTLHLLL